MIKVRGELRKRVSIITFHSVVNPGAVIQAYALAQMVSALGCESRIIDYRPAVVTRPYLRGGHLLSFSRRLLQYAVFSLFVRRNLPLTRGYRTERDFSRFPVAADYVICGSDQIWNTRITNGVDPAFTLSVPLESARKIAYGVSMGSTGIGAEHKAEFLSALTGFEAISVRERFTGEQLASIGWHKELPVVLDPSLLPVDYSAIIPAGCKEKPHIVVYSVIRDDELTECALRLQEETGLPVMNISAHRMACADQNEYLLDPGEWLKKIRDAALVCTNSFHGTALAIAFRRRFYTVGIHGCHTGQDNRVRELLSSLNLNERVLESAKEIPQSREQIMRPIDYDMVASLLHEWQDVSLRFLKKSLQLA